MTAVWLFLSKLFSRPLQFALRAGQAPESGLLAFLRLINCGGAPRRLVCWMHCTLS